MTKGHHFAQLSPRMAAGNQQDRLRVAIAGGSGYAGGELLRLLLFHPHAEVVQVTSEKHAGTPVARIHPNLRQVTRLKFCSIDDLQETDLLFFALPHGRFMNRFHGLSKLAPRIIDLSGDFRLTDPGEYARWYGEPHPEPGLLGSFVYGICELHRAAMAKASRISSAGCNATATILALAPLFKHDLVEPMQTVVEVKAGTSQGGNQASPASHHPERSGSIRTYKPAGHRHIAEMVQELRFGRDMHIHFTATSLDMVRGVHAVCHAFLKEEMDLKALWQLYRQEYEGEPFIRIVRDTKGIYRLPEPKLLAGTNYCDIGFVIDPHSNRVIIFSAIDNLMKGAAGQAVQAFNIMNGFEETAGLEFPVFTRFEVSMCRLLYIKSEAPFEIRPHLETFARIAQESREYQGHGWGLAALDGGGWQVHRSIRPLWEDELNGFGRTTLLLAHARSAFRDEDIGVDNNMPFTRGRDLFIFNGEVRGVKVKSWGRIGAEKIFNYIRRFDRGDLLLAAQKALDIICRRSERVRAMNLIMGNEERMILSTLHREDPNYFTLHKKRDRHSLFVCSEPYPGEAGWTPMANNTFEVLS